ncbi:glutathione S-transferase family protein [Stutzerimonas tarimensis]|uniref:Glutathione S-transferase family protein n=1 Tax=Stutzerimonas tarimensis TaxID=1507735 RepID=A0ABV7T8K2_9GAMM
MSRILYGAPLSPFVRKLRISLQEKDLDHALEMVMPYSPPDWYFDLNPLGRIPAFKDGDITLADSSVIGQYLDDAYPATTCLYGESAADRARVRWLEKYADYEVAPHATFTVFGQRLLLPSGGQQCDDAKVRHALDIALPPLFDYLEQELGNRRFFVSERLSMADIAIVTQWINMDYGDEPLDARRWPNLARHDQAIRGLPTVRAILQSELWIVQKLRDKAARPGAAS